MSINYFKGYIWYQVFILNIIIFNNNIKHIIV